jgi:hypothetical protein
MNQYDPVSIAVPMDLTLRLEATPFNPCYSYASELERIYPVGRAEHRPTSSSQQTLGRD